MDQIPSVWLQLAKGVLHLGLRVAQLTRFVDVLGNVVKVDLVALKDPVGQARLRPAQLDRSIGRLNDGQIERRAGDCCVLWF